MIHVHADQARSTKSVVDHANSAKHCLRFENLKSFRTRSRYEVKSIGAIICQILRKI